MTKAQTERLALLLEELGEAQQAIGKILRHGYGNYNPDSIGPINNKIDLQHELGDVMFAIELLCVEGDLDESAIYDASVRKAQRVWKYLHHQNDVKYFQRLPSRKP